MIYIRKVKTQPIKGQRFSEKGEQFTCAGSRDLVSCFFILSCAAVTSAQRKGKGSRFDSGNLNNFLTAFRLRILAAHL